MPTCYTLPDLTLTIPTTCGNSILYICQTCGTRWATVEVTGSELWQIESTPCVEHLPICVGDVGKVPGSILPRTAFVGKWADAIVIDALPPALLVRELQLHLNYFERNAHDRDNIERQ